ncbi:MAG: ABC-F family ATP-binding cassette domain-containing protein [Proteobacteria bacterium]|nr:ABC-F family ATP-binding cassette domain-containing protein [Pseudomonadota bacterium]
MPPVLILQDIRVAYGDPPLLDGATLSVAPGERLALIGRNGSGKSTLLKIAAGMIVPDGGTRFLQPGTTLRYLPQEPDLTGFATTLAYVEAGLVGDHDSYRAQYLLGELGLSGTEDPAHLSGGEAACRPARCPRDDQPRPALPRIAVARDGLARPRHHAPARARLFRVRGMARRDPDAGRD